MLKFLAIIGGIFIGVFVFLMIFSTPYTYRPGDYIGNSDW